MQSFKYLGCVVNEGMEDANIESKVMQGSGVACVIRARVNTKGSRLGCARWMHENVWSEQDQLNEE